MFLLPSPHALAAAIDFRCFIRHAANLNTTSSLRPYYFGGKRAAGVAEYPVLSGLCSAVSPGGRGGDRGQTLWLGIAGLVEEEEEEGLSERCLQLLLLRSSLAPSCQNALEKIHSHLLKVKGAPGRTT